MSAPFSFPAMVAADNKLSPHVHYATVFKPWARDAITYAAEIVPIMFDPVLHGNAVGPNPIAVPPAPYDALANAHLPAAQQTAARSEHGLKISEFMFQEGRSNKGTTLLLTLKLTVHNNLSQTDRDIAKGLNNTFMATPIEEILNNLDIFYHTAPPSVILSLEESQHQPWTTSESIQSQLSLFHKINTCYETLKGSALSPSEITAQLMSKSTSGPLAAALAFAIANYNLNRPRDGRDIPANLSRDPTVLSDLIKTVIENLSSQQLSEATSNYAAASNSATIQLSGTIESKPADNRASPLSHKKPSTKSVKHQGNATQPAAQKPPALSRSAIALYKESAPSSRSNSPIPTQAAIAPYVERERKYCRKHGMLYHSTEECTEIKRMKDPKEKAYYLGHK